MAATTGPSSFRGLLDATPPSRNKVVDLLRVLALLAVVLGHWVMQGVFVDDAGTLHRSGLLGLAPWTHPFTWLFQVMPVFFLVGGYANAISWRRARSDGLTYGAWLQTRLRRLTRPLLPLMVFWAVVAPVAQRLDLGSDWLRIAGKASLVPTWFLAVYLVVVALVPLTLACWDRWGPGSVVVGLVAAGLVDLVSITADVEAIGGLNLLLVWGTLHQLGYAWLDGRLRGAARPLLLAWAGFGLLVALVSLGPYGVSMVGVNGYGLSNTYPPRVTLALLGLWQAGIVIALEPPLQRLLRRRGVWLATALTGRRIMTVYLWHLTALGLVVAVALRFDGAGLRLEPDSAEWWLSRPLWFLVLAAVTLLVVLVLGRFEDPHVGDPPPRSAVLPMLELAATVAALAAMAAWGIARPDGTVLWYLPLVPVLAHLLFGGWWFPWGSPRFSPAGDGTTATDGGDPPPGAARE